MNSLAFLHTPTASIIRDMDKAILLGVIHDETSEGSYFVKYARHGNDLEVTEYSLLPGTIKQTFGITSEQFVTYIN